MPLARVPVDHVAVPPGHRLAAADAVEATDLDGEPVLVVDRADAPTRPRRDRGLLRRRRRPAALDHARRDPGRAGARPWSRSGPGIGWLNSWQAERGRPRTDVAVRPLRPVGLYDEFRVVWRAGDTSDTTAAFVATMLETCVT